MQQLIHILIHSYREARELKQVPEEKFAAKVMARSQQKSRQEKENLTQAIMGYGKLNSK